MGNSELVFIVSLHAHDSRDCFYTIQRQITSRGEVRTNTSFRSVQHSSSITQRSGSAVGLSWCVRSEDNGLT